MLLAGSLALACAPPTSGDDEVGSPETDGPDTHSSGDSASEDDSSGEGDSSTETGTQQFSLSGTVVGLQGASLSLSDGAGGAVVISADGAFDFPEALATGTSFSVVVSAQPEGPDQSCVVDAGEGDIENADFDGVVVRCVTPIRHVVILGIDGLGGNFVSAPASPEFDALAETSSWTLGMQNAIPTWSATNWMSMIGGGSPDQHGVLDNDWSPGDTSPPPTLFAVLRAARPDAQIGVFHDWDGFDVLVEPGVVDELQHPGDEHQTMDAAVAWAIAKRPDLLMIHLDHVDHVGHFNGWASGPYNQAVEDADALLGQLRTALEAVDMWPYTALIISADHGGVGLFHSTDTPAERAIPFLVHTPQGPTITLQRELRIWDIAATAAHLLEIEAPPQWVGQPVYEAIENPALSGSIDPAPTLPLPYLSGDGYTKIYDDTGTGAFSDVSFWRPVVPEGYISLGDVAVAGHGAPDHPAVTVAADHPALVEPIAYEKIWSDAGAGGELEVTLWNPLPPAGPYICPGQIAKPDHGGPPALGETRCVHERYLQPAVVEFTWDDTGSGAAWDGSVWSCREGAGSTLVHPTFLSRRHHAGPGNNECFGLRETRATPGEAP